MHNLDCDLFRLIPDTLIGETFARANFASQIFTKRLSCALIIFGEWSCIKNFVWINFCKMPIRKRFARQTFMNIQILCFRTLTFRSKFTKITLQYRFFCRPEA